MIQEQQILVIDPHVVVAITCILFAALGAIVLWVLSLDEKKQHK